MSSLIAFKSQVYLNKVHCYLDDRDNLSQKWAQGDVHDQIMYESISLSTKLPVVKQATEESILIFLRHQNSDTELKDA